MRLYTYERIVCPNCEKITILDTKSQISVREKALQKSIVALDKLLESQNLNEIFVATLKERENVAEKVINDPWSYGNLISSWCALSHILSLIPPKYYQKLEHDEQAAKKLGPFLKISSDIIHLKNEIDKLKKNQAQVLIIEGNPVFCVTEKFPLAFIPKDVEKEIMKAAGEDLEVLTQWVDGGRRENIETIITQGLAMFPAFEIITSEIINRNLKFSYNFRLFPSLDSKSAKKFVDISSQLLKDLLYLRLIDINEKSILTFSKKDIYNLPYLKEKISKPDIDWYFGIMNSFLPHNLENIYWLPFFSIRLLHLAIFKWSGKSKIGKDLNYVGKTVEEIIFNLLQSFEAQTLHPITKEPLIRVVNPDTNEEIADVMIYDNKNIIQIESKFWDCPNLEKLETEIHKFKQKVELFKTEKTRWGFPNAEVFPIFYTPFAPYSTLDDIQFISSRYLLFMYLSKLFNIKEPELIIEDAKLEALTISEDYPIPYPLDTHEIDEKNEENKYRLQDGCVVKYSETEIDVKILNPIGGSFTVTFEINNNTFDELKKQKISPGEFIRMGILNLSGSWSISQMLYFQKINPDDPIRKIKEIWGNTGLAEEIIQQFKKHKLDIFAFIEFCKARTSIKEYWEDMVAARMATVLHICDSYDVVLQCPCGQIMGFTKSAYEQRKRTNYKGILCHACLEALHSI